MGWGEGRGTKIGEEENSFKVERALLPLSSVRMGQEKDLQVETHFVFNYFLLDIILIL